MARAEAYEPTERTTPTRARDRAAYDHDTVHAILDAGYVCHLGFVRDGSPVVLPTLYGRVGDRLYLHGSTGSRPLRMAGAAPDPGLEVCVTVTHVDGLVLARSAFHHSINYRCVVVHGTAHQVTDEEEKTTALDALVDHVLPGRAADSRPGNAKELAATSVIRPTCARSPPRSAPAAPTTSRRISRCRIGAASCPWHPRTAPPYPPTTSRPARPNRRISPPAEEPPC